MKHVVQFVPSGRGKAQCAADPAFPNGIALEISHGAEITCKVALPYPAPECGHFLVTCETCGYRIGIPAAGRADDPISVVIPCKKEIICKSKSILN